MTDRRKASDLEIEVTITDATQTAPQVYQSVNELLSYMVRASAAFVVGNGLAAFEASIESFKDGLANLRDKCPECGGRGTTWNSARESLDECAICEGVGWFWKETSDERSL